MERLGIALRTIWRALFPYRSHLEDEIVYLRTQLARANRRIDELEGRITPIPQPRRPAPKLPEIKQPIDLATLKEQNREQQKEDEQSIQA